MPAKNMSVAVNVTVAATVDDQNAVTALAATYSQGPTSPAATGTVVAPDGSIDLQALDTSSGNWKRNADISWAFTFPALANGVISLLAPKTVSMVVQPYDMDMVPSAGGSSNQLLLEDKGRASASCTYAILLAWQPAAGGPPQLFMLDPGIVNRGPN